jgi:tetratricopeptide (TPR) repeat protein
MVTLGQELNDADIITIGMSHQGTILRARKRYETALKCFEAAKPFADVATTNVQGVWHKLNARVYYDFGDENGFTHSINTALDIAAHTTDNIDSLANEFRLDTVLEEQASGYTALWQPEKALAIYHDIDRLRSFRPLREKGSLLTNKAQTYLEMGDLDRGIKESLRSIKLASDYQSRRHIGWIEKSYNRVRTLPFGKDKKLEELHEALLVVKRKQETW